MRLLSTPPLSSNHISVEGLFAACYSLGGDPGLLGVILFGEPHG